MSLSSQGVVGSFWAGFWGDSTRGAKMSCKGSRPHRSGLQGPLPVIHSSPRLIGLFQTHGLIGHSAQLLVSPGSLAPIRWQRKGLLSSHLTLELLIPLLPRFLLSYPFPRRYLQGMGHWSHLLRTCWERAPWRQKNPSLHSPGGQVRPAEMQY